MSAQDFAGIENKHTWVLTTTCERSVTGRCCFHRHLSVYKGGYPSLLVSGPSWGVPKPLAQDLSVGTQSAYPCSQNLGNIPPTKFGYLNPSLDWGTPPSPRGPVLLDEGSMNHILLSTCTRSETFSPSDKTATGSLNVGILLNGVCWLKNYTRNAIKWRKNLSVQLCSGPPAILFQKKKRIRYN